MRQVVVRLTQVNETPKTIKDRKMKNLVSSIINKAKLNGIDVRTDEKLTLQYKKTKFKTFSGKFIYSTRNEFLSSLFSLAKNGYPTQP